MDRFRRRFASAANGLARPVPRRSTPIETGPDAETALEASLEASGAVVGDIVVVVDDVFDNEDPRVIRWANHLHRSTREGVVLRQLAIAPGDRFESRRLRESERILRACGRRALRRLKATVSTAATTRGRSWIGSTTRSRRFLATLEQRFFTDKQIFRLAELGFAVFVDVGRSWFTGGTPEGGSGRGILVDAGVGLRLALTRAGEPRMIHVDFAVPYGGDPTVDSFQVLVTTKEKF